MPKLKYILNYILLGGALLLTTSSFAAPQASVTDVMIKREMAVWQAAQDTKPDVFASFLDSTYSAVYADGVHSREAEIDTIQKEHLRSFALSSIVAKQLDEHNQMLTYKITVKGDFGGTDFSDDYWAMSMWRSTGGKWLLVAHAEAKMQ